MNCRLCGIEIPENCTFCPGCGKKLKEDETVSLGKEVTIYVLSFVLVPIGLYWFFKYFKSVESTKKRVAYISLIITVTATVFTIAVTASYIKTVKNYLNSRKYSQYKELGL